MLKLPKPSDNRFEPAPAGNHAARCIRIIDFGTQPRTYMGQPKPPERQISITFELVTEMMSDGRPFVISTGGLSFSMHEKAKLRKLLESWRGVPFADADFDTFDIRNLLGKPAMVNVIHVTGQDGSEYARIDMVARVPKGFTVPNNVNEPFALLLTREDFDETHMEKIGQKATEKIMSSPEWAELHRPANGHSANGQYHDADAAYADEIPF